jgi:hypothetical protein
MCLKIFLTMYLYCLKQSFGVRIVSEVVTNRLGQLEKLVRLHNHNFSIDERTLL